MFQNIPRAIISAVAVPYSFNAIDTIASLLGTIPWTWNPCSNMLPIGANEFTTSPAPPPNTKNPKIVLIVPFTMSVNGFFWTNNPIIAINPTKIDGTFKMSTIRVNKSFILPS